MLRFLSVYIEYLGELPRHLGPRFRIRFLLDEREQDPETTIQRGQDDPVVGVGYRLYMDEPDGVIHDQADALKRALVALVLRGPARHRSPAFQPMLYGVGYGIDRRSTATLNPEPRVGPYPIRHFGLLKRQRDGVHARVLRQERARVVRMRINPDSVQVVVD